LQADKKNRTFRQGFALLLTLSVLVIVIALTGILINYLDTAREDAVENETLVQANLYYTELKGFLETFKNRKKDLYSVLYRSPIPKKVFDTIVQRYDIADPALLEEMIVSASRGLGDNVVPERLRQSQGIVSYAIFNRLLTQYAFRAEDNHAFSIPWDRFFAFHAVVKGKKGLLAGDYLTIELLSVIFGLDEAVLKEVWVEGEGALKQLSTLYGVHYDPALFSEKFLDASRCEVHFEHKDRRFLFAFSDIDGEVKRFEFFGEE